MALAPLTFTGISSFSDDFQVILDRSVSIASLPARALEQEQKGLLSRKVAAGELRTAAADLAAALRQLGQLSKGGALTATSSSFSVQATAGELAAPGLYRISDITSLASQAVARSSAGFADTGATAVTGGSGELELVLGGESHTIALAPGADNLAGVRDAINAGGYGVTASILDTGSGPGRYYLSITASETGERSIELRLTPGDPGSNLLTTVSAGSNAAFKLNGLDIVSSSNTVTSAIAGVTLELKALTEPGQTIDVSVQPSAAGVAGALQSFTAAYNKLVEKLDAQTGQQNGPLLGETFIRDLKAALRDITGFRGEGPRASLFELGVSIGADGVMSFDPSVVQGLPQSEIPAVFTLLGDGSSGLSALEDRLAQSSDAQTGAIAAFIRNLDRADQRLTDQINAIYERVNATRQTLVARLQAADTLLARLEGQRTMLNAAIESLQTVAFGKRPNST
ncbi:MAG: flagellar filament capping protein FliD [Acidobacteriota bacterium]